MTFYDDAELAAAEAVRLAVAEQGGAARSAAIHETVGRLYERHGSKGISAIAAALARWTATAFEVLAEQQGKTPGQFIDEWEMHKLTQHGSDEE